jgi:transposase
MNETTYPSDLTDEEWEWIKDVIPAATSGGRPRTLCMRAVLHAILTVTKGGSQGRMLPTTFPKWQSVSHDLRAWKRQGGSESRLRYAYASEHKRSGTNSPRPGVWLGSP